MAEQTRAKRWMPRLAQWHVWLGWLIGVPLVMWTATGLFMVAKPIEEVRGNHLRIEQAQVPVALPLEPLNAETLAGLGPISSVETVMQGGRAVAIITDMEGTVTRIDRASGETIAPLDEAAARALVAARIVGGDKVDNARFYEAENVPIDFRRPKPVWRVTLEDGANIYVGRDTGEIEAVRARWWRWFDFMWGLHIMDLQEREDTSHSILIAFAALSLTGALMGCILLFRRRKARAT